MKTEIYEIIIATIAIVFTGGLIFPLMNSVLTNNTTINNQLKEIIPTITTIIPILAIAIIATTILKMFIANTDKDVSPMTEKQIKEEELEYNPIHEYTWNEQEVWYCGYCDSMNPINELKCHNCYAPRGRKQ